MSTDVATNPSILGEDVGDAAWLAVGLASVAMANDKLVHPMVSGFLPGDGGGTMSKLVDAGTTGVTAWLGGELVGFVDRSIGHKVKRGGVVLAIAKVISAFIPSFSISANFPMPSGLSLGHQPAAAIAAATTTSNPIPSNAYAGARVMGL